MDCGAVAAYRKAARKAKKVAVVDNTALARPKVPAMLWLRRIALACGVLAATMWSGGLAAGPVEDALSLVAQGRYAEARALLRPLMEREPDAPEVRLLLGVLHAREGNYAEAIAVFERLREDHSAMFEAHNNLAVLYAKLGRLEDARAALVAAVELKPDAVVYANLGDVYMKLAERAYERAHTLQAAQDAASKDGGQVAARSEPEEAPVAPAAVEAATEDEVQPPPAQAQQPESAEEREEAPERASVESCVHAGWFRESDAAYEAAAWMRARGATQIQVRSEEQQIIKNYQVYLPPAPSRDAARALGVELRDKGVSDIWIIDRGEKANGISLGVFRSKGNTSRRVAELEKLGYSVLTTANTTTVTGYVVEARAGGDPSAFDDDWKTTFPEQAIRYVDCAD